MATAGNHTQVTRADCMPKKHISQSSISPIMDKLSWPVAQSGNTDRAFGVCVQTHFKRELAIKQAQKLLAQFMHPTLFDSSHECSFIHSQLPSIGLQDQSSRYFHWDRCKSARFITGRISHSILHFFEETGQLVTFTTACQASTAA